MGFKTWTELNEQAGFDGLVMEMLLREAPRTRFQGDLPPGFEFLTLGDAGFVDLGFEHLGLSNPELSELERAFSGRGVVVPGTKYRLRHERPGCSQVEECDGSETATFPPHWKQGVLVLGPRRTLLYVGRLVPDTHSGDFDHSRYTDTEDGWTFKVECSPDVGTFRSGCPSRA